MNRISYDQRQEILEYYAANKISWSGKLEEPDFLAKLYDLKSIRSTDPRFENALGDIWQHRVNNDDWAEDWVYTDSRFNIINESDIVFLNFICMTLHPLVRDRERSEMIRNQLNKLLRTCGYEIRLQESTLGVASYRAADITLESIAPTVTSIPDTITVSSDYIRKQIDKMIADIDEDTESAIGRAKEFIETICRHILAANDEYPERDIKITELVKLTRIKLCLLPDDVPQAAKGRDTITRVLSNLGTIAQGLSELRGLYGSGHGKGPDHKDLWHRHARLAVNSSIALGVFLWETHDDKGTIGD